MRLLLDTQALLWFYLRDAQLSPAAQTAIVDPDNVRSATDRSRGAQILYPSQHAWLTWALLRICSTLAGDGV